MANKKNDGRRKEIKKLRTKGLTLERIAEKLDISVQLVAYYLK